VLNVPGVIGEAGDRGTARFVDATVAGRARILVADDSITTRALEESVLAAAGYDVVTAPDGAEALRIIEGGGIDLLVTDVEMPTMTGLELCTRIRASRASASLPVIIVSSLDRPEHRAQGMEAGADAYVTKSSFEQGELIALVERLLGSGR
jgi:two-component system chemotaxis sensor kinase CheA